MSADIARVQRRYREHRPPPIRRRRMRSSTGAHCPAADGAAGRSWKVTLNHPAPCSRARALPREDGREYCVSIRARTIPFTNPRVPAHHCMALGFSSGQALMHWAPYLNVAPAHVANSFCAAATTD